MLVRSAYVRPRAPLLMLRRTLVAANNGATLAQQEPAPDHAGPRLDPAAIFVLSIPITSRVSYVHCNHRPQLSAGQTSQLPFVVRAESKVVATVARAWTKLSQSDSRINRAIVRGVRALLAAVPYDENCLLSFPAKLLMIREVNRHAPGHKDHAHDNHDNHVPATVFAADVVAGRVQPSQLVPIPVYHPQFQTPPEVLRQLHHMHDTLGARHRSRALWCAVGVPLSLPFALVPVVPNVPGFYLAYRLYCHIQALRGVKNLGYLLESDAPLLSPGSVHHTSHLAFRPRSELDRAFALAARPPSHDAPERLLLSAPAIDRLVQELRLPLLAQELHRALAQELARLGPAAGAPPPV